jgi:hypothetical protein
MDQCFTVSLKTNFLFDLELTVQTEMYWFDFSLLASNNQKNNFQKLLLTESYSLPDICAALKPAVCLAK